MKRVIWFVLFCSIMIIQSTYAQNKVTEQQKSEYAKGNRDRDFLKEYIEALKVDGQTEILNDVIDEYLMTLPFNERYVGENLSDFMEYVTRVDARTFIDIIKNWEKLSLSQEQADQVAVKVDNMCKMDLFNVMMEKEEENGKRPAKDYTDLQTILKKSSIPISDMRRYMIDMWQCWGKNDVSGMIQVLGKMVGDSDSSQEYEKNGNSLSLDTMFEGVVIGNMMNYVLEECNLDQCSQILEIMDHAIEKNGRTGRMEMFARMRDNFEGKDDDGNGRGVIGK